METKLSFEEVKKETRLLSTKINCLTTKKKTIPKILNEDDKCNLIEKDMPRRFIDLYFGDFEKVISEENFEKIKKYIKDFWKNLINGKGMIFVGPVGTAKTAAACLLMKYAYSFFLNEKFYFQYKKYNKGVLTLEESVQFVLSGKMLFDYFGDKESFLKLKDKSFLIIDDITKPTQNFFVEVFDFVIRHRELNNLPTILTSQLPMKKLKEFFGLPVYDLIKGNYKVLKFLGKSKRWQ